jgi:hypothetical protein
MSSGNSQLYLYVILLGCEMKDRLIEQHDIYFGIGESLQALAPRLKKAWRGAQGLHVDGFMKVQQVENYKVEILPRQSASTADDIMRLYFINLGGYAPGVFDEMHYRMLAAADSMASALAKVKQHPFYSEGKDVGNKGRPHVDDKYDLNYEVDNLTDLNSMFENEGYSIRLTKTDTFSQPEVVLGYMKVDSLGEFGY